MGKDPSDVYMRLLREAYEANDQEQILRVIHAWGRHLQMMLKATGVTK